MNIDINKFLTVSELAEMLLVAPIDTQFDFTFDTPESVEQYGEPTGWYGVKLTRIFDEHNGVLCFGYYGGGCTRCVDIEWIEGSDIEPSKVDIIRSQLLEWIYEIGEGDMTDEGVSLCVEVDENNYYYLSGMYKKGE